MVVQRMTMGTSVKNRGLVANIILAFVIWAGLLPVLPIWHWARLGALEAQAGLPSDHLGQNSIPLDLDLDLEDDHPLATAGTGHAHLTPPRISSPAPEAVGRGLFSLPLFRLSISRAPPLTIS